MNYKLLSFGHGYSAHALEKLLSLGEWKISATARSSEKAKVIKAAKVTNSIEPDFPVPTIENSRVEQING